MKMNKKDHFLFVEEIGDLYLYDVLLSYIYPRVFVCEDEFGCKYLFYEIESDDNKDSWLVTKIRRNDYYNLIDKKNSIQYYYKNAAERDMFSISRFYGDNERTEYNPEYKPLFVKLPKKDVYAENELTDDLAVETLKAARDTGNATLDIRLFPGTDRHYVPKGIFSDIINSVSSLIDSVFGKRNYNKLRVCTTPGSCVVRFSFDEQVDLLDESSALQEVAVIDSILRSDSVEENLGKVKNKTGFIKSYSNLLRTIGKTNNPVQVSSAFPNSEKTSVVELTSDTIVKKVDQIDEFFTETVSSKVYKGFLVALDMRSRRFKLEEDNGSVIQGTIDDTLLVESFNVPDRYVAEIKTTEFVDRKDLSIKKVNRLITLSHNEN